VSGSFFPSSGNTFFNTCVDCLVSLWFVIFIVI
jgi:hypothetical protein